MDRNLVDYEIHYWLYRRYDPQSVQLNLSVLQGMWNVT